MPATYSGAPRAGRMTGTLVGSAGASSHVMRSPAARSCAGRRRRAGTRRHALPACRLSRILKAAAAGTSVPAGMMARLLYHGARVLDGRPPPPPWPPCRALQLCLNLSWSAWQRWGRCTGDGEVRVDDTRLGLVTVRHVHQQVRLKIFELMVPLQWAHAPAGLGRPRENGAHGHLELGAEHCPRERPGRDASNTSVLTSLQMSLCTRGGSSCKCGAHARARARMRT